MKVLIIGAGNLGNALAADLLSRKHEVTVWAHPDHPGNIADISAYGLTAMGEIEGFYMPYIQKDLGPAVLEADSIIVTIPSSGTAREELLTQLALYQLEDKILLWIPGNLTTLIGPRLTTLATFETTTSPYACRLQGGKIFVKAIKSVVEIASDKSDLPEKIRQDVESLFPCALDWRENIMEIALLSPNCMVHPAAVLMNVGRIEDTGGDFFFYRQGMTPSVGEVVDDLDKTRLKILAHFNFKGMSTIELLNRWYGKMEPDIISFVRNSISHNATKGSPGNMRHRYMIEDCGMLVFYKQLAEKLGIKAKVIEAVLTLASIVTNEDFEEIGLTLSKVGLVDLSAADLLKKWGSSKKQIAR